MKIGNLYDITFSTNRADTGAIANADSTPIVRVTENWVNLAYTPTVSSLTTWVYITTIDTSLANGFEVGKRYSVYVTATVNGVDWANGLDSFTLETRSIDDVLPTSSYTTAPSVAQIRTELSPELALIDLNLDAKVSEAGGWSGWLTTEEHDKLMNITNGGWFSINYQAINSHTTSKVNELKEELAKSKTDLSGIENTLNDIDSHIELAKGEVIDTINEIENEICSDVVRTKTEIKKDNVSTRQLIRQKAEKIDKNVSKLADRQDLTDKMIEDEADELEDQIEELYEKEADDLEKEIEDQFNEEFDQIESEINQLTNGNN